MKYYIEITQLLSEEQENQGIQPEFVRIEKQSEQECRDAAPQIVALLFSGKTVKANIHICGHDEGIECKLICIDL